MDPVQEQLEAYNTGDLERFIACYAPEIIIEDGAGNTLMTGHESMRQRYGPLFESSPELHCHIANRMKIGSYVIDEEKVSGVNVAGFPSQIHAVVIYRVEGGKIVHTRMLR
jgi:hypothetical protein